MCGIVGLWQLKEQSINKDDFKNFVDSIKHRGPNGSGHYFSEEETMALGHRRLSILDLSEDGNQPMWDFHHQAAVVFNGELYNFLELRSQLESQGRRFKSNGDTEVFLNAYLEWGDQAFSKMNGMWAAAIWMKKNKKLILSRDRFGVKPLFYFWDQRSLAFASEMKAFCQTKALKVSINEEVFQSQIFYPSHFEATENTWLKNTFRLTPGSLLEFSRDSGLKTKKWWNLLENYSESEVSLESCIEEFTEIFTDACKLRMRSDVPLATTLSGGLDSSSVALQVNNLSTVSLTRTHPDRQRAYIATFPNTLQDERYFADQVVRSSKLTPQYVEIPQNFNPDLLKKIFYHLEEPFDLAVLGPWLVYQAFRDTQVPISIDGHGGDEILAGYHHHFFVNAVYEQSDNSSYFDKIKKMWSFRSLYPSITRGLKEANSLRMSLNKISKEDDFLASFMKQRIGYARTETPWVPGPIINPLVHYDIPTFSQTGLKSFLNYSLFLDFQYLTLPAILRNFDRMSMAHGVEVRSPFLDYRVVKLAFSLPAKYKISGPWTKYLLRRSFQNKLPKEVAWRRSKVGFSSPSEVWIKNGLNKWILSIVNSENFKKFPLLNGEKIAEDFNIANRIGDFKSMPRYIPILQSYLNYESFFNK